MVIIDTIEPIKETRGREPKYPFRDLNEGETLVIDGLDDRQIASAKSAFYQFKKYHKLPWATRTRINGSTLYIHRIS